MTWPAILYNLQHHDSFILSISHTGDPSVDLQLEAVNTGLSLYLTFVWVRRSLSDNFPCGGALRCNQKIPTRSRGLATRDLLLDFRPIKDDTRRRRLISIWFKRSPSLMCHNPCAHWDAAEVLGLWKVTVGRVTAWLAVERCGRSQSAAKWKNPFSHFFSPLLSSFCLFIYLCFAAAASAAAAAAAAEETGSCFVLSLLLWPNSELERFKAVTCTHSYSFVSIETLSPLQAWCLGVT